jgi:hypothetical protein
VKRPAKQQALDLKSDRHDAGAPKRREVRRFAAANPSVGGSETAATIRWGLMVDPHSLDETICLRNAAKNQRLCKKSVLISAIRGKLLSYVSKHQNVA